MALSNTIKDTLWALKHNTVAKVVLAGIALAIIAGVVLLFGRTAKTSNTNNVDTNTAQQPVMVRRAIDGLLVQQGHNNPLPVAVMVENLTEARPQAGLEKANLVYEALAEGGITRFLAIFAGGTAEKIGPVRSARAYYVDWAKEYNAMYVHAGGSPDGLAEIAKLNILDLSEFSKSQYFWRDAERRKKHFASEHTLYTSSELLARATRDLQFPETGTYAPWAFADDPAREARPATPQSIRINFSSFSYNVEWRYDQATNRYLRFQAEQPHAMENGAQIDAKNIIVAVVPTSLIPGDTKGRLSLKTLGQGAAMIFHNSTRTDGTWTKATPEARMQLADANGAAVTLTEGTTWIEIIPDAGKVAVQ